MAGPARWRSRTAGHDNVRRAASVGRSAGRPVGAGGGGEYGRGRCGTGYDGANAGSGAVRCGAVVSADRSAGRSIGAGASGAVGRGGQRSRAPPDASGARRLGEGVGGGGREGGRRRRSGRERSLGAVTHAARNGVMVSAVAAN